MKFRSVWASWTAAAAMLALALTGCPEKKKGTEDTGTKEDTSPPGPETQAEGTPETTPDASQDAKPDVGPETAAETALPDGGCASQCTAGDPTACNAAGTGRAVCEKVGDCWEWVEYPCLATNSCSKGPEECYFDDALDVATCRPKITIPPGITDPDDQEAYWIAEATKGCGGGNPPEGPGLHPECVYWECVDGTQAVPDCKPKAKTSDQAANDCSLGDVCIQGSYCFNGECVEAPSASICPVAECNAAIVDLNCDDQGNAVIVKLNDPAKGINKMSGYGNAKDPQLCGGFEEGYIGHERVFKIRPQSWTTKTDPADVTVYVELLDPASTGTHVDAFWWVPESGTDPCYPNLCQDGEVMLDGTNALHIEWPLFKGAGQATPGQAEVVYLVLDTQAVFDGSVRLAIECQPGLGAEPFCSDGIDGNGNDEADCASKTETQDAECAGTKWCASQPTVGEMCTPHTALKCGQTKPAQALAGGTTLSSSFACSPGDSYAGKKQVAFLADPGCTTGTYSVTLTHQTGKKTYDLFGLGFDCLGTACKTSAFPFFGDDPVLTFDASKWTSGWVIVTETFDGTAADAVFDVSLDCSKCQP